MRRHIYLKPSWLQVFVFLSKVQSTTYTCAQNIKRRNYPTLGRLQIAIFPIPVILQKIRIAIYTYNW